jgi:hypothetical protein
VTRFPALQFSTILLDKTNQERVFDFFMHLILPKLACVLAEPKSHNKLASMLA